MFSLEVLKRINTEGPHLLTSKERREFAIRHLEDRLGVDIDRDDPMLGAMAAMEMWLLHSISHEPVED
jgi:hypothetical protein